VLGASGTAIRFAGDDGVIEETAVAELAGSGRLQPGQPGGRPDPQVGLAGRPPELAGRARWREAHIVEVVDGTRRTRLPGPRRGRNMTWSALACASGSGQGRRADCAGQAGFGSNRPPPPGDPSASSGSASRDPPDLAATSPARLRIGPPLSAKPRLRTQVRLKCGTGLQGNATLRT
jgi:hypothetical protein